MDKENKFEILRPFGPSVARFTMPADLIDILNEYTDKIILDEKNQRNKMLEKNLLVM